MSSTIFALSSGSLPCAIAMFRISGPKSLTILNELSRRKVWVPRRMEYTKFYTKNQELIDEGMAVYFPAPKTFTGEDTAELFVHGSAAVASYLAQTLSNYDIQEAKRGEFTRRAFMNNKLSLNKVHGIDRLIRSKTQKERKMAFSQMRGGAKIVKLREKLTNVLAKLFVVMDFGEHVEMGLEEAKNDVMNVLEEVKQIEKAWNGAEIAQRGLNIVLYGRPNSGKSSLLNCLAHDDVAIVSPVAGTTRDVVEINVEIGGVRCRLTDTAGIRMEANDLIEEEGIRRAREKIRGADIILIIIDPATSANELNDLWNDAKAIANPDAKILIVRNKQDLRLDYPNTSRGSEELVVEASTILENGIDSVRNKLSEIVDEICPETTFLLDASLMRKCSDELISAIGCSDAALMCSKIERALENIGELSSNVVSEDVLDTIFNKFCIGK